MLEEMQHDRIICGINSAAIQIWLISESNLSLVKAISVAHTAKIVDTGVKELLSGIAGVSIAEDKDVHKCTLGTLPGLGSSNKGWNCYHCSVTHKSEQ